ncbi:hypothetical protein T492DRAFT_885127 [Pavlovales sp. CCMP2436]|nr:hypothetical protein T492DRAFT_885127 [Pavlovales sp. CCMP2436]
MDFLIAFSAGVLGYKSYLAMQRHPADRRLTVEHIKLRKPDEPLTPLPDCSSTADPLKQQAALQSHHSHAQQKKPRVLSGYKVKPRTADTGQEGQGERSCAPPPKPSTPAANGSRVKC